MSDRARAGACAICALVMGGLLRLYRLDDQEITPDEAFSWRMARLAWRGMFWRLGEDVHPPLYYLVLKGTMMAFGDSLTALRGLSALLGCLTIAATFWLANRVVPATVECGGTAGRRVAALAASLVAVSPFHVGASRTARMYPLGTLAAALSCWALLGATQQADRRGWARRWLVFSIAISTCIYTHNYLIFSAAAQGLFVLGLVALAAARGDWERSTTLLRGGLLASLVIGLTYLPWVPSQAAQLRSVWHRYWIPELTTDGVISDASYFFAGLHELGESGERLALGAGLAAFMALTRQRIGNHILLLLLIVLPWCGGIGVSVLGGRTILLGRYLIFAHLFYLSALSILVMELPIRPGRIGLVALLLLNSAFGLVQEIDIRRGRDEALGQLVRCLSDEYRPGQLVLVGDTGQFLQLRYHLARAALPFPVRVIGRPPSDGGHQVYAAAILEEEWISPKELDALGYHFLWGVGLDPDIIARFSGWRVVASWLFAGREERQWTLVRFRSEDKSPPEPVGQGMEPTGLNIEAVGDVQYRPPGGAIFPGVPHRRGPAATDRGGPAGDPQDRTEVDQRPREAVAVLRADAGGVGRPGVGRLRTADLPGAGRRPRRPRRPSTPAPAPLDQCGTMPSRAGDPRRRIGALHLRNR